MFMSDPKKYTQSVDLTSRAQEECQRVAEGLGTEPADALPPVTLETLPEIMQQAVRAVGWETLMEVQQKGIPYLLDRRDLIVQARTGTGKTGAFLLPLFELLDPSRPEPQVLILAPTRELARQIHDEFDRMKRGTAQTNELEAALIYGGVSYGPQLKALRGGAQVVIGTPGRILDHLSSKNFSLDALQMFILDEADEMLSMGFYPAMRKLKKYLPEERQSYMFSATMPPKVRSLSREFLEDPGFLSLSAGHISVDAIEHWYYLVPPMEKDSTLARLIELENPDAALVFCNTKREVSYLAKFLQNNGFNADEVSGDLSQKDREKAMARIRSGEVRILVATDVAARGIDILELSHVFLYDVPQDREYFIHRSGRTARAGRTGTSIALVTHEDEYQLVRTAKRYGVELERRELPAEEDVHERVDERAIVELERRMRETDAAQRERMERFVPLVERLARDEPELLALLVEEVYDQALQRPPEQPDTPKEGAGGSNGRPIGKGERASGSSFEDRR